MQRPPPRCLNDAGSFSLATRDVDNGDAVEADLGDLGDAGRGAAARPASSYYVPALAPAPSAGGAPAAPLARSIPAGPGRQAPSAGRAPAAPSLDDARDLLARVLPVPPPPAVIPAVPSLIHHPTLSAIVAAARALVPALSKPTLEAEDLESMQVLSDLIYCVGALAASSGFAPAPPGTLPPARAHSAESARAAAVTAATHNSSITKPE